MNTHLDHLLLNRQLFCIGVFAITMATVAANTTVGFDKLIANPKAFAGQRVSVQGVAEVDGISFVLFQPPAGNLSREIFVGQKLGKPRYNHLDHHWVKLTGVVGLDKEKIFACKIFLEDVQPLPLPPLERTKMFGIFLNEGPTPITVELYNKAGQLETKIKLEAHDFEKTAIAEGRIRVMASSGKPLSTGVIKSESAAGDFLEASTRTFYFRIANGKIEAVRPRDALELKRRSERLEKHQ